MFRQSIWYREPLTKLWSTLINRMHNVSAIYMGFLTISITLPRVSAFVHKRVKNLMAPKTVKQVRSFLGMVNYYKELRLLGNGEAHKGNVFCVTHDPRNICSVARKRVSCYILIMNGWTAKDVKLSLEGYARSTTSQGAPQQRWILLETYPAMYSLDSLCL
jgi:hypothetical protein